LLPALIGFVSEAVISYVLSKAHGSNEKLILRLPTATKILATIEETIKVIAVTLAEPPTHTNCTVPNSPFMEGKLTAGRIN
jgi:hypothetical protein